MIYEELNIDGWHQVWHAFDNAGFDSYIAIHNVNLGPAMGGCRAMEYETSAAALEDALNLSKGMTYKNALAGLRLGGGKSVINGKTTEDNLKKFADFINFVNRNGSIYWTAGDMNTGSAELDIMAKHTEYVNHGGTDSGWATAYGVYQAMLGACDALNRDLPEEVVSITGFGKVGERLGHFLSVRSIPIVASDVHEMDIGIIPQYRTWGELDKAHHTGTIWAPCAAGGAVNDHTIKHIPTGHIICGGANNQLADPGMAQLLKLNGITYVPDYLANAGGVIIISKRGNKYIDMEYDHPEIMAKLELIRHRAAEVVRMSLGTSRTTAEIADEMAEGIFM